MKYNFDVKEEEFEKNAQRLTNQLWKLIPMREHEEDWQKQLDTVILEIVGLDEIFIGSSFIQLLSKLEGLRKEKVDFEFYRKTIFECISLLRGIKYE
jgi:hypothetical protein|nr:MAG TPA: hypothetical protein [Caudoviricetes sp.]DAU63167.1 MAG TPA: hypothetical protein [Caudoviricetes sp.]